MMHGNDQRKQLGMHDRIQAAKTTVRAYQSDLHTANPAAIAAVLAKHMSPDVDWRGVHPFYEQHGPDAIANTFWSPLGRSFRHMARREDVFFAGFNDSRHDDALWVVSMGTLYGLFDQDWLGINANNKLTYLRYAEFSQVEDGQIVSSALFCDIIGVMQQAGQNPLPPQTGAGVLPPGPATQDGIVLDAQDSAETEKTIALLNGMIKDLDALNKSGNDNCPPETLRKSWHETMIWHGPAGIGSTYTISRYQEQHQHPFRQQLKDKVFNGHIARLAEGNYAGFFGWANLTNTPTGGFLGLPANDVRADMRVVDIYRRDGDKLAENWVLIDLLHWLSMQGLDILKRQTSL